MKKPPDSREKPAAGAGDQALKKALKQAESIIHYGLWLDLKIGDVIFIEVGCDVHKDRMVRKQKWMKLVDETVRASNGKLYAFCDNLNCQEG